MGKKKSKKAKMKAKEQHGKGVNKYQEFSKV